MTSLARWAVYGVVAVAFGPLWYELVALAYTRVFAGMPPAVMSPLQPRATETLAACAITSLGLATLLRRRIAGARGIDTALVSGAFLLAGAVSLPPLWWLILLVQEVAAEGPDALGQESAAVLLTAPLLLAASGLAWTALIVWVAWPVAALQVWLQARVAPSAARAQARSGPPARRAR